MEKVEEKFEPKIAAFVCNWCTYTGADLAGTSRLKQQTNARLIRVPCTGRIDPVFIIKAFENGADGVLVSGCHPGDCHYNAGNFHARRRWIFFKELLDFVGIDSSRLHFSWVSASEGKKWVDVVDGVINSVREKGPFTQYKKINREIEIPLETESKL
jgi:coenzyme F420-reducing hydrogenase delta subunit